jgi:polysaccharide pyruvyl transferase WcaK-like protein
VRWHTPARRWFLATESRAARAQLGRLAAFDEVVYNPAGELLALGAPVSRFLELSIAHLSTQRFAAVSFTFEPSPVIDVLARQVLPHAQVLLPRDERSAERLVACGVDADRVHVTPDVALLHEPTARHRGGRGASRSPSASP